MGVLDAPGLPLAKSRIASLLTRLAPASTNPLPPVTTDTPTVTFNTTPQQTARIIGPQSGQVTEVGSRGSWNAASQALNGLGPGVTGLDFYMTGTTCEVVFVANTTAAQPIWIWVDGLPVTAAPDTSHSVTSSTTYYVSLTFGSSARRRIEFFAAPIASWTSVRSDNATLITPAPRKPVVAFIGDSFYAGSAATVLMQSTPFLMSRMLGVECFSFSYGGTGYVQAGSFNVYGSSTRTTGVAAAGAELVVLSGSVNDDPQAGVQTAAAAAFAAYAAAVPKAKLIVFGPQPSNAVDTISTARATQNAAVKTAALAASNVLAFHDMVGTAAGTVPATWSSGATYNDGDLVTYKGSVWKLSTNGVASNGSSPGSHARWQAMTMAYTGTGKIGTTASDGTRDTYLYSDGVHPMPEANMAFTIMQAALIRADLLAAAL